MNSRKCGNCCFYKSSNTFYGECAMNNHKPVKESDNGDKNTCKHHLYREGAEYEHNTNKITL